MQGKRTRKKQKQKVTDSKASLDQRNYYATRHSFPCPFTSCKSVASHPVLESQLHSSSNICFSIYTLSKLILTLLLLLDSFSTLSKVQLSLPITALVVIRLFPITSITILLSLFFHLSGQDFLWSNWITADDARALGASVLCRP